MSSPSPNPPADLWRRLALLRDRELCRSDWRRHLGAAFPAFAPFLEELPGTVAESYPDPDTGLPLIPRRTAIGTFTAFSPDHDETRAGPVESIPAVEVTRHRILWTGLGRALAKSIRAAPHDSPGPLDTPWVREIGLYTRAGQDRTAIVLITGYAAEALGWLRHLLPGDRRLFVLPVHDPLAEDLAVQHGHHYFALNRDLCWKRTGARWIFAAAHRPKSPAALPVPAASTKPVVVFSDNFRRAYCKAWPAPEIRRARQANNILRMLFEQWRDRRDTPLFKEDLLAGRSIDRLDIALSKHSHPRTWDLIRQQPDERTGKTRVWLRDDYTYEEQ